ncbi:MAG: threonine--tRNA ligase [Alphaproteobacteria bacterium GM202ARS2]|nr:threonine--tRNA ligase [Alphaproteobacteria bacterium GM202ARS2]
MVRGGCHHVPYGATALDVLTLEDEKRLADVYAVKVNGVVDDLSVPLRAGASLEFLTRADEETLEILRHDTAHLMAQAVKSLYPETKVSIGPVIRDGFYYDFARDKPFTPEDLERIEARMHELVAEDYAIERLEVDRDEARRVFTDADEPYKVEILESIPEDESLRLYRQGDFIDLCRGPHFQSTGRVGGAFKLMKVAGAYWRGDSSREMLQRIYGTAWFDGKALRGYLERLREAAKRDHREMGKVMDLFHFQPEAPGAVFWHDKGWTLFGVLIDYLRQRQKQAGYEEISTPEVIDRSLWESSGHWQTFREHMFTTDTEDGRVFAVKPMNCPGCVQVFRQGTMSYRDLPRRMAEFGKVHRYEPSGALYGLMRVRAFTQDDAHIYCTPEQMEDECCAIVDMLLSVYRDFGFEDVRIKFADRPQVRIGSDEAWTRLEQGLLGALKRMKLDYTHNVGEGAFYGPKLEFVLRDALGRDWQCGTVQVDVNLPARLGAFYVGADGDKHHPVMLHRALFGSLERFIGILLEHYAGVLPLWLAPVQGVVMTITEEANDYAEKVCAAFRSKGVRMALDIRNEKIGYKVREHSVAKVPYFVVVGAEECREGTVAVRSSKKGAEQQSRPLAEAVAALAQEARMPSGVPSQENV